MNCDTTASLILGSSPIKRDTEYYYFADMQIKNHHPTAVIQEGDGNGLSSEHMYYPTICIHFFLFYFLA